MWDHRQGEVGQPRPPPHHAVKSIQGAGRAFITVSALITLYLVFNTSSKTKKRHSSVCACVTCQRLKCVYMSKWVRGDKGKVCWRSGTVHKRGWSDSVLIYGSPSGAGPNLPKSCDGLGALQHTETCTQTPTVLFLCDTAAHASLQLTGKAARKS